MKILVIDRDDLLKNDFITAFDSNGISAFIGHSSDEAAHIFIKNPDVELILFLIGGEDTGILYELYSRLRNINATLNYFCIFEDALTLESIQEELDRQQIRGGAMSDGLVHLVERILSYKKDHKHNRQEHRLSCNLQAHLYQHDELDQKKMDTAILLEVISLSANGAYVASQNFKPEKNSTYLFEINMPDFIYIVKGEVVWINVENKIDSRPRGFAMRFMDMSKAPQQLLKNMIEEDLVDSILQKYHSI